VGWRSDSGTTSGRHDGLIKPAGALQRIRSTRDHPPRHQWAIRMNERLRSACGFITVGESIGMTDMGRHSKRGRLQGQLAILQNMI
jgi:hypothetical protein